MASYNDNLPGGCFVNEICIDQHGIQLDPEIYAPYFSTNSDVKQNHKAYMLVTHGQILITTDAKLCNILCAINELQLRQDELKENFEPAIVKLLDFAVQRE